MPYPNQHAARLQEPSKFSKFRRIHPKGYPDGIDAILGFTDDGKSEIQAIRADSSKFTFAEFKKLVLEKWNMKPINMEEATGVEKGFDTFSTWAEIRLEKAENPANGGGDSATKAYIEGVISSDSVDLQGDKLLQEGMVWDYFIRRGWLNYEHQQGPENIVGVPTEVKAIDLGGGKSGTYLKGYLLVDRPKAREIVETVAALKKATSDRKIGFSVEGQVLARDPRNPKIITKSRILNVSITAHPVNPDASTLELIARSIPTEDANMTNSSTAQMIAEHIMRMHPELSHDGVLEALLNELDGKKGYAEKGGEVGYQTPATPDSAASLSALVPQSIEDEKSSKNSSGLTKMTVDIEVEDDDNEDDESEDSLDGSEDDNAESPAKDAMDMAMRQIFQEEMSKMMNEEVNKLLDAAKGTPAEKPMISLAQLSMLVSKVFPSLSTPRQKDFARNLLNTARGYYNTGK